MKHKVQLVVLSRFPALFLQFKAGIDKDCPSMAKNCVWDAEADNIFSPDGKWMFIQGKSPFNIARNANLGWMAVARDTDILYCGDDVTFHEPDTVERLQKVAYSNDTFGIVSPDVHGPFNAESPNWCAFVCVYIKRSTLEKVGFLDEHFEGYGLEDLDYCLRVRRMGLKVWVSTSIHVIHAGQATFRRVLSDEEFAEHDRRNRERFAKKWGCAADPNSIYETIRRSETAARV